jgi:hypothetical protein
MAFHSSLDGRADAATPYVVFCNLSYFDRRAFRAEGQTHWVCALKEAIR